MASTTQGQLIRLEEIGMRVCKLEKHMITLVEEASESYRRSVPGQMLECGHGPSPARTDPKPIHVLKGKIHRNLTNSSSKCWSG